MNDEQEDPSQPRGPRAPTIGEVLRGRDNIAIQHMTIALNMAEAPAANEHEASLVRIPGWRYPTIRAHLRAALDMLLDGEDD